MMIKKPSVFIYVNDPDASVLKEVCAGIEEEGLFYEIESMGYFSLDELAWNAANDSMLGVGIGTSGASVALQIKGIKMGKNIESYRYPSGEQSRRLGANSARAIKRLPFK